jgi:U3 small nucleolar RNA-associated protein 22
LTIEKFIILSRHLKIEENHVHIADTLLEPLISLPSEVVPNYGTGEERLTSVLHTLDDLVKILKSLKDMPLNFTNVQSVSSVARLTDVFAPLPCCFKYDKKTEKNIRYKIGQKYLPAFPLGKVVAPYIEPIKVCCLLETSTKWPDNIECIKRLKCAFNLKMVQILRETYGLNAFTNIEFSDVVYKGYVFRLFVGTTRELMVMKSHLNENGVIVTRDTDESLQLEKNIFHLTKLTSVLHGYL